MLVAFWGARSRISKLVLSIGKLGRGQENYYLATVAQGVEDYYTGSGEAPGEWTGAAAARLGLAGDVDADDLRLMLGGVDPNTGVRLGGQTRSDRVPGWDLTFSAPKSVSVLYALGNDRLAGEVVDAHRAAVAAAVGYLESHATLTRRRVDGKVEFVRGQGLVVAAFRHRTSRAGDPQLHTHCLVGNVVSRADGGWGALYSREIYRHARTAGFVYQAVLRGELSVRVGVEWGPVRNGHADIAGIDRPLIELFSKRRHEIEASLRQRGEDSARAAQAATLDTRRTKEYAVDPVTLHERWRAEAAGVADLNALRRVFGHRAPVLALGQVDEITDRLLSGDGLTEQQASFDRRDVVRGWCEGLPPGLPLGLQGLEGLVGGLLQHRRVVPIIDGADRLDGVVGARRRWSTIEMLNVERRLLERADEGRRAGVAVVDHGTVDAVCAASTLSAEQAAMVRTITTSGDRVDVVVGRAGTGKTYALAAAAGAWRAEGVRPVGVALAARAAVELEVAAGIPSSTIDRFLIDADRYSGVLGRDTVVIVDEAGMVDTRRLGRLIAHVDSAGAKVVLVGDHHQLPAVDAGGAFASLVQRLDVVELTENRRQIEVWERAALDQLRVGGGGAAGLAAVIDRYDTAGRLHVRDSAGDVRGAMVEDWYQSRQAGERSVMVALRRRDVDELNARARALLVADGTVDREAVSFGGVPFAVGDRVVCLRNDRGIGVHNSMFATINRHDADAFHVTTDQGAHRRIPFTYARDGHVAHAYATTIHKAQGATYDRAFLLGDDALYRQAAYTALSRGATSNDIYLVAGDDRISDLDGHGRRHHDHDSPTERLVRALSRDGAKLTATDERETAEPNRTPTLTDLWREHDRVEARVDLDRDLHLRRLDTVIAYHTELAGHAAELERPGHVTELIGEPPPSPSEQQDWRGAAGEIESYIARWSTLPAEIPAGASDAQLAHLADLQQAIDRALSLPDIDRPVADYGIDL